MNTKALRQKILDLAIRGKLVPQDPNDEPASVLLERIRAEKERLIKEGKIKRPKKAASSDTPHYENVPFEVPEEWTKVRLEEICSFLSRGKSPKYSDERKYPVFAQKCNLKEGGISLDKAQFLDPETLSKWTDDYKLRTGDVLINSTGTGTVGRTRYFDEVVLGEYPFVVPDSHVSVVRTMPGIVSKYIYAVISSPQYQQYLEDNLAGSTNQKELYIGVLSDMEVSIPPYKEQQRIVDAIEKWCELIAEVEFEQNDLQTLIDCTKSKILDLAIHGKLVPQGPADEPAEELLKRVNPQWQPCDTSPYGNLPRGWCLIQIKDAAQYSNGKSFKPEDWESKGKPIIRIQNLNNSSAQYNYSTQEHEQKYLVKRGDLLFAWAASLGAFIWNGSEAWLNQHIFKVAPMPYIRKDYLYYAFNALSTNFGERCHGSGMVHITKNVFESMLLPLPPLAEQQRIVAKIETLFTSLDSISAALAD